MKDPYTILGVTKTDSMEIIKKQYHKKLLTAHPDKGGNNEEFIKIQKAYKQITNDTSDYLNYTEWSLESLATFLKVEQTVMKSVASIVSRISSTGLTIHDTIKLLEILNDMKK